MKLFVLDIAMCYAFSSANAATLIDDVAKDRPLTVSSTTTPDKIEQPSKHKTHQSSTKRTDKKKSSVTATVEKNKTTKDKKSGTTADDAKQKTPVIKLGVIKDGKTSVLVIPVEEYLRNVLPQEVNPSWHSEALKAQAIAARTFALKNRNRHTKDGYDLCNTTHCQQYSTHVEDSATDEAIFATKGEVMLYKGEIIEAVFHTDSGGVTADSEEVWGNPLPYLTSVKEPTNQTSPWQKEIPLDDFAKKAGVKKVKKIVLSSLDTKNATDRGKSGRVKQMKIMGDKSEKIMSGNDIRKMFGLNSTLFEVKLDKNKVVFKGYGAGHGVGMSQRGAAELAKTMTYQEILKHYYQGIDLKKIY